MMEGKFLYPIRSAELAMESLVEFEKVNRLEVRRQLITPGGEDHGSISSDWVPPGAGLVRFNCDVSFLDVSKDAAIGFVCRNENGQLIDGKGVLVKCSSVLAGELLAIKEGLRFATAMSFHKIIVESDSAQAVASFKNNEPLVDWEVQPIINEIRTLAASCVLCSFDLVARSANAAADWVARSVHARTCPVDWVLNPPNSLYSLI